MPQNLGACGHTLEIIAVLNYCNNVIDLFAAQELNSPLEPVISIFPGPRGSGGALCRSPSSFTSV